MATQAQQPQVPMIEGVVKLEAVLKDPPGTWESSEKVQYPQGAAKLILFQAVKGVMALGLISHVDSNTIETIPLGRVEKLRATMSSISLADNFDLAVATRGIKI